MNILSLFDGMGCGYIALRELNIPVDRYVAYEIDKYAIQTALHNFPDIEQRGDVKIADFTEFEGFDWVLAGFPCTKFSIAQKKDRETKPYSGEGWELFEEAWRAVQEAKPKYFLFENNKSMAKAVQQEISKIIGFEPVLINSALVSAQNRQRIYWVGVRNADGTYSKVAVEQPADRGILLKDVLDDNSLVERIPAYGNVNKSRPINANYSKNCGGFEHRLFSNNPNKQQVDMIAEPVYVGELPEHDGRYRNGNQPSQQYRVYADYGKSVCVDTDTRRYYAIPVEFADGIPTKAISAADGKVYPVYEVRNGLITVKGKQYPIKLKDGYYIIRKLTVSECRRLQTIPDWYVMPCSDSQNYKMLGNGWTVEVIKHLVSSALAYETPQRIYSDFMKGWWNNDR